MAVSPTPAVEPSDPQPERSSDAADVWKFQPSPASDPTAAEEPAPEPRPARRARVRGPGLQAKIILLMVVSLALLALISSFATSTALRTRMVADTEARAEAIAQGLATSAHPAIAGGDDEAVDSLVGQFAEIEGVSYLVLYDRRGRPVASSREGTLPGGLAAAPEDAGGAAQMVRLPAESGKPQVTALDVSRPLTGGAGTVRVGMDFESILAEVRRVNVNLLVTQGLVALIAVLFAFLFSARLVRPIRTLVKLAQAVGRGDLSHTVRVRSTDEVGLLSRTFNDSIRRLRGLVITESERDEERARRQALQDNIRNFLQVSRQVSQGDLRLRGEVTEDVLGSVVDSINLMIEEIGGTLLGVREAAETVHAGADDVLRSSGEVAERVREQLETARTVSRSVTEVTHSMRDVTQRAETSSGSARQAREAAQTGRRAVGETLESMQRIRSEVQGISRRIKALGDRSLEISEIVDTITNISSQTNLLALNAAIEASGAGEQGARFAVVADEVRKLAEESSTSSKRIAGLIKAVQSEILDAVGAMEEGTEEVETGYRLAQQAGDRLEEIASISEASAEVATEISERTSSQAEGIDRVAESVRSISGLAQKSDRSVAEGRQTAERLRQVADQLAERLSRFQLPEAK